MSTASNPVDLAPPAGPADSADRHGADQHGADQHGADQHGAARDSTDRDSTDRDSTDRPDTDRNGLDPDGAAPVAAGEAGAAPARRPGPGPVPAGAVQPGAVIDVTRLRVAIARLSRRLRKHELVGLTPTQLSALSTVDKAGPVRLGDLAAAEGIAPSTLTRLVSALEDSGYVLRCSVPGDARASTLAITDLGHAELERIRRETTSLLTDSLTMLPAGQLAALAAALPALEHLADAEPAER